MYLHSGMVKLMNEFNKIIIYLSFFISSNKNKCEKLYLHSGMVATECFVW